MSQQADSHDAYSTIDLRRPVRAVVALWVGALSFAIGLFLIVPFLARGALVALPVAAVVSSGLGILLALRAAGGASSRSAARALVLTVVGAIITVALLVAFLFSLGGSGVAQAEVRGQGPDGMTAAFSSEGQSREETWNGSGTGRVATAGSWVELTLVAPEDASDQNVSCQIVWNGEVVVDESSGSGMVTCRYDEN